MDLIFPERVMVTGVEIDLANMHEPERAVCIAEARRLYGDWKASGGRRVVGIAGPSGAGKSVFVAIVRELIHQLDPDAHVVGQTIDAYHFPNAVLEKKGLKEVKGRYDTYDVPALIADVTAFRDDALVSFPHYSRTMHEPVAHAEKIEAHTPALLFVEGLWTLYGHDNWEELFPMFDESIYLEATTSVLRERTIGRHVKGGRSLQDAERFYDASDLANSALVMATKSRAGKVLRI